MEISNMMKDFNYYWRQANFYGYVIYFLLGASFDFYFFRLHKEERGVWKVQVDKDLSPDLERNAILIGCGNLLMLNTLSAAVVCYVMNGGPCTLYYDWNEYGVLWWIFQWPAIFIYFEYLSYLEHRAFHHPSLYRFHKTHHKYQSPTAYVSLAMHPVEIIVYHITYILLLFFLPVHTVPFLGLAIYLYYRGMESHCGINMKPRWWLPFEPPVVYHDDHHRLKQVNFGFNWDIWDRLHGTYKPPDESWRCREKKYL